MSAHIVSITVVCAAGHTHVLSGSPSVSVSGGCYGHHGEDDYCYCDSATASLEFNCLECPPKKRCQEIEL